MPTRREYLLEKRKRQTATEKERIERSRFGGARAPTDWWDEPRDTAPTRGQLLERKQEGEIHARRGRLEAQDIRQMYGGTLQPQMSPEQLADINVQRRETLPELYPEPTTRAAELGRFEGAMPPKVQATREIARQAPGMAKAEALGKVGGVGIPPGEAGLSNIETLARAKALGEIEAAGTPGIPTERPKLPITAGIESQMGQQASRLQADAVLGQTGLDAYIGYVDPTTGQRMGGSLENLVAQVQTGGIEPQAVGELENFVALLSTVLGNPQLAPEAREALVAELSRNSDIQALLFGGPGISNIAYNTATLGLMGGQEGENMVRIEELARRLGDILGTEAKPTSIYENPVVQGMRKATDWAGQKLGF